MTRTDAPQGMDDYLSREQIKENHNQLLVCPKCARNLEALLLNFHTDPQSGQDYQRFCWVCPGVETQLCNFPFDIPPEVVWCRRSREQAEQNLLPLPNIHLLPERLQHLYSGIFPSASKGAKAPPPPTSVPLVNERDTAAPIEAASPTSRAPKSTAPRYTSTSPLVTADGNVTERETQSLSSPVPSAPQKFIIQSPPTTASSCSSDGGLEVEEAEEDEHQRAKDGTCATLLLPYPHQVLSPSNPQNAYLVLEGKMIAVPPVEMPLKQALLNPIYKDYFNAIQRRFVGKGKQKEQPSRLPALPAPPTFEDPTHPDSHPLSIRSEVGVALAIAPLAPSRRPANKEKKKKSSKPKKSQQLDKKKVLTEKAASLLFDEQREREVQTRMGWATSQLSQDFPYPRPDSRLDGGSLSSSSAGCHSQFSPIPHLVSQGREMVPHLVDTTNPSGHSATESEATIPTSLETRVGSNATASSATTAGLGEGNIEIGRTLRAGEGHEARQRQRLNTEIGVEGGVGVFGGEPLEESFGDPYIDQLVHREYMAIKHATLTASKQRSPVGGQERSEKESPSTVQPHNPLSNGEDSAHPSQHTYAMHDDYASMGYATMGTAGLLDAYAEESRLTSLGGAMNIASYEDPLDCDLFDFDF